MAGMKSGAKQSRWKKAKKNILKKTTLSQKNKKRLKTGAKIGAAIGATALAAGTIYAAHKGNQSQTATVPSENPYAQGNLRGVKHNVNYKMSNDLGRALDTHLGGSVTTPPNAIGAKENTGLFSKTNLARMSQQNAYKAKHGHLSPSLQQKLADTRGSYKATSSSPHLSKSVSSKLDAARAKHQASSFKKQYDASASKGHPFGQPSRTYDV